MDHVVDLEKEYTKIRHLVEELKKKHDGSHDMERQINSLYNYLQELGGLLAQKIYYKVNF